MRDRAVRCLVACVVSATLGGAAWCADPDGAARTSLFAAETSARLAEVPSRLLEIDARAASARHAWGDEAELDAASRRLAARLVDVQRDAMTNAVELRIGQRDVEQLRRQLAAWSASLASRIPEVQRALVATSDLRAELVRTLRRVRAEPGQRALARRITAALRKVRGTHARVERELQELLEIQGRVARERALAEDVAARLDASEQRMVGAFLTRDSPTLWAAWSRAGSPAAMAATVRETFRRDLAQARDYLVSEPTLVPLLILIFVAVSTSTLAFKRAAERFERRHPEIEVATRVLDHPASVGLLFLPPTFLLPYLGSAPALVRVGVAMLVVVPLVRVVTPLVPLAFRGVTYLVALLMFTGPLIGVLREVVVLERSLFVVQCIAASVILVLARRRLPATATFARVASTAAVALLVAAIAADVAGRAQLAHYLGAGVIRSLYILVFAFTLLAVMDAFVAIAVHSEVSAALRRHGDEVKRRAHAVARLLVILLFVVGTLEMFGLREPVVRAMRVVLASKLTVGELALSLGDVLAFCVTVWLSFRLSRILRALLEDDVLPHMALGRGVPYAITTVSSYAVLVVGFLFALAAGGIGMDRIAVLAGAFGVGAGFGLQNVVSNFVSGLVLLFERPIQIGDVVQLGDVVGEVRRIGLRSSVIRTGEGAEVILPNSTLVAERVTNWTLSDARRRVDVRVAVALGTDPQAVQTLLNDVAARHPAVLKEPPPGTFCLGFGDGALDFELQAWIARANTASVVHSDLVLSAEQALSEAGIAFPAPTGTAGGRPTDVPASPGPRSIGAPGRRSS